MDSDAQLEQFVGPVADAEGLHGPQQVQGERGDLAGVVVAVADGQAADDHVGVADRLHLVHVVVVDDRVEQGVQVVEKVHNLWQPNSRSERGAEGCAERYGLTRGFRVSGVFS